MNLNELRRASILLTQNAGKGTESDNMKVKGLVKTLNGLIETLVMRSCPHKPAHSDQDSCQEISIRMDYMKTLLRQWFDHLIFQDTEDYTVETCDDPFGIDPATEVHRKIFTKSVGDIKVKIDHLKFANYFEVGVVGRYDKYGFRITYNSNEETLYEIKSQYHNIFDRLQFQYHDILCLEPLILMLEAELNKI